MQDTGVTTAPSGETRMQSKPLKDEKDIQDDVKLRRAQLELIKEIAAAILRNERDRELVTQALVIAISNLS